MSEPEPWCVDPALVDSEAIPLDADPMGFSAGDLQEAMAGSFDGALLHWDGGEPVAVVFELSNAEATFELTFGTETYPSCYTNYEILTELELSVGPHLQVTAPIAITVSQAGHGFVGPVEVPLDDVAGEAWVPPGATGLVVEAAYSTCWSGFWRWDYAELPAGAEPSIAVAFDGGCEA